MSSSSSSTTNDFQAILQTAVLFGIVSIFVFWALLRSTRPGHRAPAAAANRPGPTSRPADSVQKSVCTRVPPHFSEAGSGGKKAQAGGANVVLDGMLAFRYTKATVYEASLSDEEQTKNRKDRVRVLSNLLMDSAVSNPPVRGGSVVLAVPVQDVACPKLRRVVFLLASYYNLLLVVNVEAETKPDDLKYLRHRLRGAPEDANYLAPDVLPDHRILAAATATGRVALVRQLQRIDLVLDFESEVKDSLSRFGHRVILYGGESANGQSRLAAALY